MRISAVVQLLLVLLTGCSSWKAARGGETGEAARGGETGERMGGLGTELILLSLQYSQLQGKLGLLREVLSVGNLMQQRWSLASQCMPFPIEGYDEPSIVKLGTGMATVKDTCTPEPPTPATSVLDNTTVTSTASSLPRISPSPSAAVTGHSSGLRTASSSPLPSSTNPSPSATVNASITATSPSPSATVNASITAYIVPFAPLITRCELGWDYLSKHFKEDRYLGLKLPLSDYVLDAEGKLGAGVLEGNVQALGSYDECLSLPQTEYCVAQIGLGASSAKAVTMHVGLCLPVACGKTDVLGLVREVNRTLEMIEIFLFGMKLMNSTDDNIIFLYMEDSHIHCTTGGKPKLSLGSKAMLALCALLLAIVVVSTFTDWLKDCCKHCCCCCLDHIKHSISLEFMYAERKEDEKVKKKKLLEAVSAKGLQFLQEQITRRGRNVTSRSPLTNGDQSQGRKDDSHVRKTPLFLKVLTHVSLFKTVPMILSMKQPPHAIRCLNGVRVISMFWVILAQTHYWVFLDKMLDNPLHVLQSVGPHLEYQVIANATFSADTFFFLSGLLMSYHTLRELKKSNVKVGRFAVRYYLHRYLRLTPTYAFVLFFFWLITMYLADGPNYITETGFHSHNYHACRRYWWANLLYISNFVPGRLDKMCMEWTAWYLANDWQFYVVSPLLVVLLYFFRPLGTLAIGIFFVGSFVATAAITSYYNFTAGFFALWNAKTFSETDSFVLYQEEIYTKPYARITPYLVGIITGYAFYRNYKIPLNKVAKWIVRHVVLVIAGVLLTAPLFGLVKTWNKDPSDPVSVLYITFSRCSWGIGLAFVVFACNSGHGGTLNSFLSMRIWVPLSRLTFSTFLVHPIVLTVIFDTLRVPLHYTTITLMVYALAVIVLCYGAAFVVAVFVEFPLARIEEVAFELAGFKTRESFRLKEVSMKPEVP